jgi:hypothetical protein
VLQNGLGFLLRVLRLALDDVLAGIVLTSRKLIVGEPLRLFRSSRTGKGRPLGHTVSFWDLFRGNSLPGLSEPLLPGDPFRNRQR